MSLHCGPVAQVVGTTKHASTGVCAYCGRVMQITRGLWCHVEPTTTRPTEGDDMSETTAKTIIDPETVHYIDPREWVVDYATGITPFPFVEDENANITGLGHQDPVRFNAEIQRYDREVAGMREDELEDWTSSIGHSWAVLLPDGERLRRVEPGTPLAFPITTLWNAR